MVIGRHGAVNITNGREGRTNTLGLQQRELDALLDDLDKNLPEEAKRRRQFVRRPFRRSTIRMFIFPVGGPRLEIKVACRNISAGGMSVLHSAYLHLGTKVSVFLPHLALGEVEQTGHLCRGCHVSGMIHELGVKFDKPIKVSEFVRQNPFEDTFSLENVEPEQLKGTLVYVEDSPLDQRIVKHFLNHTHLRLRVAQTPEEGLKLIYEGCDLVLTDYDMPAMTGVQLVERIRSEGIDIPVIMATSDTSVVVRDPSLSTRVNAFLTKPLQQQVLLRALAEFMIASSVTSSLVSTLSRDHSNFSLVAGFVEHAHISAKRLDEAIARNDAATCRSVVLQIKGVAPTVGFESLGRLADEASRAITASMSVQESIRQLRALIAACERVRQ